uniref:Uncharacterized protein n=1 Tax=Parascaris equorum TaxID=6256 RepID=A0A914RUD7_PAREQ
MKDQEGVKVEDSPSKSPSGESSTSAQWKKERQADADEQWFNDDDTDVVMCKQQREGATNGAARSPLRVDSDSVIKPSGEDTSPSSSAGSSPVKEQLEDDKDSDAYLFWFILISVLDDDSDDVFSPATNASRIRGTPRIVIKVVRKSIIFSKVYRGDRILIRVTFVFCLDVHEQMVFSVTVGLCLPSSSSSAGRPSSNPSSQSSSSSADDHDDVSSTSGDHEPSPGFLSGADDGNELQHGEVCRLLPHVPEIQIDIVETFVSS